MSIAVEGQRRKIELRGVLILSIEERSAHFLRIDCSVIQLPYSLSTNLRYNPPSEYFGTYTFLNSAYCVEGKLIVFRNQSLYTWDRKVDQAHENLGSYGETIMTTLTQLFPKVYNPSILVYTPGDDINLVINPLTTLKFVLPEGCVIEVATTYVPFEKRDNTITVQEEGAPPPPPDAPPGNPPEEGSPPTTGRPGSGSPIEISPPYDRTDNDNGDTYVPPGEWTDEYGEVADGTAWIIRAELDWRYKSNDSPAVPSPGKYEAEATIYGRYVGLGYLSGSEWGGTGAYVEFQRSPGAANERVGIGGSTSSLDIYPKLRRISIRRA